MNAAALDFAPERIECLPNATGAQGAGTPLLRLEGAIGVDGPINAATVEAFLARTDPNRGLRIVIDSNGGEAEEALKIYSILRAIPAPTWTHVEHQCCSAAVLVFAAAAYRTAVSAATFLLHASRVGGRALDEHYTCRDLRRLADDLQKLDDDMAGLLARRTGYAVQWFAKQLETEEPTGVVELLECGLVHEIPGLTLPIGSAFLRAVPELLKRRVFLPYRYDTANFWAAAHAADHFRSA